MPRPVADQIRKFLHEYQRGAYTAFDVSTRLGLFAACPEFAELLSEFPENIVKEMREIGMHAPAHPEDSRVIRWGSIAVKNGNDDHDFSSRLEDYWSARRLREYFYPELPLPEFEPLKFIGDVEETIEWDNHIVILGELSLRFVRNHPVLLDRPSKSRITTSGKYSGRIRMDSDQDSEDPYRRKHGQFGLRLGENVTSVDDVPPGTKVWVDRTAVAEIPPPPSLD